MDAFCCSYYLGLSKMGFAGLRRTGQNPAKIGMHDNPVQDPARILSCAEL
jgi:hypothetical protein